MRDLEKKEEGSRLIGELDFVLRNNHGTLIDVSLMNIMEVPKVVAGVALRDKYYIGLFPCI